MTIIDEALSANATIANDYDPSRGGPPAPKIAIVTCADPRLTSIEQMLGLAAADVDMIRNFGTVIDDDAVRSLVLSTRLLGTREIMIINHTDCGMLRFTDSDPMVTASVWCDAPRGEPCGDAAAQSYQAVRLALSGQGRSG
jgi:carbonic anhydrase